MDRFYDEWDEDRVPEETFENDVSDTQDDWDGPEPEEGVDFDDEDPEDEEGKRHFRMGKWPFILAAIAVLASFFIFGFALDSVEVTGSRLYSAEEIRTMIGFPEKLDHTLLCYLRYARYNAQGLPFIEDISVRMTGLHSLEIVVDEKPVVGCVKSGNSFIYFDRKGVVQEISDQDVGDLPKAEGVTVDALETGVPIKAASDELTEGIVETADHLATYGMDIDRICVTEDGDITLDAGDGIWIDLGKPIFISEKITELSNILPELRKLHEEEGITGTLHLENYDMTQTTIYFSEEN